VSGTSRCHQKPAEIQRAGDTGRQGYEEVRGQKKTEDIKKATQKAAEGGQERRRKATEDEYAIEGVKKIGRQEGESTGFRE